MSNPYNFVAVFGDFSTGQPAPIANASTVLNVTVQGIPIAVYGKPPLPCGNIFHAHGDNLLPVDPLLGSLTVTAGGFGVHRVGDLRCCGVHVTANSLNKTVFCGA